MNSNWWIVNRRNVPKMRVVTHSFLKTFLNTIAISSRHNDPGKNYTIHGALTLGCLTLMYNNKWCKCNRLMSIVLLTSLMSCVHFISKVLHEIVNFKSASHENKKMPLMLKLTPPQCAMTYFLVCNIWYNSVNKVFSPSFSL